MRLIRVLVPDEHLDSIADVLDEEGVAYARQRSWVDGEEAWMVECPVPTDAIGHVTERLQEAGVDTDRYTVVSTVETATHPQAEALRDRFATDFDPLTRDEIRSKVRGLSLDARSFLTMIFASAVIATAGLLIDSPAVVVGSMVIAPIVGPVLTASVGATTGDREMLRTSVVHQSGGLATAVVGAWAFSYGLQITGFLPAAFDITSIELISLRVAPSFLTVVVGLAAGVAGAFGLATEGPTSLIGVMIAAALIPAAATVGIAAAWGELRIAVGSLLLLVLTVVLINAGTFAALWQFGYRPAESGWLLPSDTGARRIATGGAAAVLVVAIAVTGVASVQQIGFERTVNQQVAATLDDPAYDGLSPVSVQIEYSDVFPFGSPETITVLASENGTGSPPSVATPLDRRITDATGRDPRVRVRFTQYQWSNQSRVSNATPRVGSPDARAVG